uniref:Uncharacterized protein n=1 Tax=Trichuris muris TaxID=70415 RepID=A0A5S6PYJ1_TRIMR
MAGNFREMCARFTEEEDAIRFFQTKESCMNKGDVFVAPYETDRNERRSTRTMEVLQRSMREGAVFTHGHMVPRISVGLLDGRHVHILLESRIYDNRILFQRTRYEREMCCGVEKMDARGGRRVIVKKSSVIGGPASRLRSMRPSTRGESTSAVEHIRSNGSSGRVPGDR